MTWSGPNLTLLYKVPDAVNENTKYVQVYCTAQKFAFPLTFKFIFV
jgi:hypothetical protein